MQCEQSAPSGLARRQSNFLRFSRGSDSFRTKKPKTELPRQGGGDMEWQPWVACAEPAADRRSDDESNRERSAEQTEIGSVRRSQISNIGIRGHVTGASHARQDAADE